MVIPKMLTKSLQIQLISVEKTSLHLQIFLVVAANSLASIISREREVGPPHVL